MPSSQPVRSILLVLPIAIGLMMTPVIAATASPVDVNGGLVTTENQPIADRAIEFRAASQSEFTNTAANGDFAITVDSGTEYDIQFFQFTEASPSDATRDPEAGAFPRDGVPDIYAIDRRSFTNETTLADVTLPAGHPLSVRVVDTNDTPVEDATIELTHTNQDTGATVSYTDVTTTKQGWLQPATGNQTGIELAGSIELTVIPPSSGAYDQLRYTRSVQMDQTRQFTITVSTNQRPSPDFVLSPSKPEPNELITLTSTSSDPDDSISELNWDFDDDGVFEAHGTQVTHTYDQNGTKTITLEAVDVDGGHNNVSRTIQVGDPAQLSPRERALRIAGKDDGTSLTQSDITIVITRFNRDQTANGLDVTQNDVTSLITLFERNN